MAQLREKYGVLDKNGLENYWQFAKKINLNFMYKMLQ